jgi:peptidyl-prolyl cis-trans isomerase B (cyclophilin B)
VRQQTSAVAVAAVAAFCLAGATGCGSGSSGPASTSVGQSPTASTTSTSSAAVAGCSAPSSQKPNGAQFPHEPKLTVARTTYTARVTTNCGTIVIAMDGKHAPHTVNSFAFLAGKHFFDHTPCHRLTTPQSGIAVLQCGDPTGSGRGGPGYTIPDENLSHATYPAGTVAMANAGPNTGGSQFFFVYGPSQLGPAYTPFGHVTSGLNILQQIAAAGVQGGGADGAPAQPVQIESFTVTKGAP